MALEKFTWQNGSQVEPAKVEVEGISYDVVDAQYEGETPLSASNLNLMQDTLLSNVKDDLEDESKIASCKAVKDIYSETETKTNKIWIDNKPIYRKVYKFTSPSTSSPGYDLNITNLGEVTHIGFIGDYNYNNYRYRRESTYFASNDYMNCFIRDNTIQIRFENNFRTGINTLYVILEYTKTS